MNKAERLLEELVEEAKHTNRLLQLVYALLHYQSAKLELHFHPRLRRVNSMLQITDIQSVSASVSEVDAAGNPVTFDQSNTPVWSVSDPNVLDVTTNPDGTATIKAKGPLGSSQVVVAAGNLSAQDTINVVASAGVALSIAFGTPA